MSEAFGKLHPKIQEAIWQQRWDELRELQVRAIEAICDTDQHVILAAQTASGKTEAAFLPILSDLAANPPDSVGVLYISPLKALINDQFLRLQNLCDLADIPVHRWHGDVSGTEKQRLRAKPSGILLITPESLESQFVNFDRHLHRIYSGLRYVVIDELHAFLGDVRGIHLRSLLARLEVAAGVQPRRIGLSATIGDFTLAQAFLCETDPDRVTVINPAAEKKDFRVGLRAYLDEEEAGDEAVAVPGTEAKGLTAIARDVAKRFGTGSNLVFCNSRLFAEIIADKLRGIVAEERWPRDPFHLHHGSISKELREETEQSLKAGHPVTAICTSSLEMGIDIGSVKSVGQVGPPWSCASLVQRLGRCGRRAGEPQILRMYSLDSPVTAKSTLTQRLYPELIRAIALIELRLEHWVEPPAQKRYHFSTCVHQVFSILRQTGGVPAPALFDRLCVRGAFTQISQGQFMRLLRGLGEHELIQQMPTGELILAPKGEFIVQSRDFYAAFAGSIDYKIEHNGFAIGTLPADVIPPAGEFLLLNGRRWQVTAVEHASKLALVSPARGWRKPQFNGAGGDLHPYLVRRMREVLADDRQYAYLDPVGTALLGDARHAFRGAGLHERDIIQTGPLITWFPWAGTRVLRTLELCAKTDGLKVTRETFSIQYHALTSEEFGAHRQKLAAGAFTEVDLAPHCPNELRDRFDEYVDPELLRAALLSEVVDLQGAHLQLAHGIKRSR